MGVEEEGGEALVAEEGKGSVRGSGWGSLRLQIWRRLDKTFVSQQLK
jgi:hypothetical protein